MSEMPAAQAVGLGKWNCDSIPIPEMESGKVLVKTSLASICGSDLHIVHMGWNVQDFPLEHGYPGHEGIGEVVDGGDTDFRSGRPPGGFYGFLPSVAVHLFLAGPSPSM